MPIQKVEKTFKFGILSTTYRVSLQERLLQQFQEEHLKSLEAAVVKESPCRVRSAFVRSFNQEQSELAKLQLKKKAYTLLERIKRLNGVATNGEGKHVDTSLGWRECIQLAQCEDRDIINAALDILWVSLEQTPLTDSLVAVCFDVAEIILYWISNRTSRQQAISGTEIRMLQIGRLIFLRLYFYHMTCKINNDTHSEFRIRLAYQMNGFENLVAIYQNYPDAWLCARVIEHVGKMITEGVFLSYSTTELLNELEDVGSAEAKADISNNNSSISFSQDDQLPVTRDITEGVHALSPSLWHALDVFRAVESKHYSSSNDLQHSLLGLIECDIMTKTENWLDCACAMYLLADAAHRDISVLQTIERLFVSNDKTRKLWHKWSEAKCGANLDVPVQRHEGLLQTLPSELIICYAFLLTDVCLRSHDIRIQRYALLGERSTPDPLERNTPTASLADMLVLKMPDQTNEWRLRYVTSLGLMLIRRSFANDSLRNGVSSAADVLLKSAPVIGKSEHCRGQEAPVEQEGTIDWFSAATLTNPWYQQAVLPGVVSNRFMSLSCRLGRSLGKHYLPSRQLPLESLRANSLTPRSLNESPRRSDSRKETSAIDPCERTAVVTNQSQKQSRATATKSKSSKDSKLSNATASKPNFKPKRPTVGDESLLRAGFEVKAASFQKRTSNDLKNVVEDQWIKDLHASLDAELPAPSDTKHLPTSPTSNNQISAV